ncbi:MAG: phosphoribosylformylglycinamidine synthase subunit PurS [Candidatus Saganbacteria bacterium]|nr:phosphoribosylformylglycinamidine synthase subunit PurS [Candidatus Saganbacteria bacterium]
MAKVKIYVTPKQGVLDPQGKTVEAALHTLGYKNVAGVKIGKYIELELNARPADREKQINEMCKKLLTNPVIEDFTFQVVEA